eukprot:CAMPEP_0172647190 /NCGR_PEP_ID=MMETSP1068-20121228/240623_1 /TAXON_ID=35684 /ORGANISM="Pseudopedinella elastica, Strain CCMP716" /LENGTH=277 /DNA_ID=CAMNT_0013461463 /DNA_START=2817 /DNA_END=3650 /DNA_ORIENTATION=-
MAFAAELKWSRARVVLNGDKRKNGCIEERKGFTRCEFDGKLHLARHNGSLFLYARANAMPTIPTKTFDRTHFAGGRHVQVARSEDEGLTWGGFRPVAMPDYKLRHENNLYFFVVDPVNDRADPEKGATRLLALFPGVVSDVGGVYAASSQDGVNFTNPKLWLHSRKVGTAGRTPDYPVKALDSGAGSAGGGGRGGHHSAIVEHDIQLGDLAAPAQPSSRGARQASGQASGQAAPYFCRYLFAGDWAGSAVRPAAGGGKLPRLGNSPKSRRGREGHPV